MKENRRNKTICYNLKLKVATHLYQHILIEMISITFCVNHKFIKASTIINIVIWNIGKSNTTRIKDKLPTNGINKIKFVQHQLFKLNVLFRFPSN